MIRKTTAIMTITSGLTLLSAVLPARADFIPIAVPDAAYVASTTLLGIGTITLAVDGNTGARLFAATTGTDPFDSVIIFGLLDFAIANVRYGTVAAAAPEPGPTALLLLALGSMLLMHGRRRDHISTRMALPAR